MDENKFEGLMQGLEEATRRCSEILAEREERVYCECGHPDCEDCSLRVEEDEERRAYRQPR